MDGMALRCTAESKLFFSNIFFYKKKKKKKKRKKTVLVKKKIKMKRNGVKARLLLLIHFSDYESSNNQVLPVLSMSSKCIQVWIFQKTFLYTPIHAAS